VRFNQFESKQTCFDGKNKKRTQKVKRKQVRELGKTKIAMLSDWLFVEVVNIAAALHRIVLCH